MLDQQEVSIIENKKHAIQAKKYLDINNKQKAEI